MSILNFASLSSSLSVRTTSRCGSFASVFEFFNIGSSISVRSFVRLGSTLSLHQNSLLTAPTLSVFGYINFGSSMSVRQHTKLGARFSVLDFVHIASTVSVRSFCQLASRTSVLDFLNLGSTMSLRGYLRLGSSMSIIGKHISHKTSVFNFAVCGSSLSVRSFSKLGINASVFDFVHLGSAMSVRSFTRLGSTISVYGDTVLGGTKLYIGGKNNYIQYVGAGNVAFEFWAQSTASGSPTKRLTLAYGVNNNILHGAWASDIAVGTSSDVRVKKNVTPLYQSLLQTHLDWRERTGRSALPDSQLLPAPGETSIPSTALVPAGTNITDEAQLYELRKNDTDLSLNTTAPMVSELFQALRPVSFAFKRKVESKELYYGFLAQELEEIYPHLVHTNVQGKKTVKYQDIIAIVTLTVQQEMERLDLTNMRLTEVEDIAEKHDMILGTSESKIRSLEMELARLKKGSLERSSNETIEEDEEGDYESGEDYEHEDGEHYYDDEEQHHHSSSEEEENAQESEEKKSSQQQSDESIYT
jgi:acyl-[acyl carrier protein]--UDP-N-acetylglucosamine O-acyltransferase